jgi:hypothetical protein
MPETRTGRVVNHDVLSRLYEHTRRAVRPVSVLHRLDAAALDQGALNGCTGFAAAQWLNCGKNVAARKRFWLHQSAGRSSSNGAYMHDSEAINFYCDATELDDFDWTYPPTDNGSSGLGVSKALKACGAIFRYEWTFTFTGFLAALQVQPVLLGTAWPDSLFDPDRNGIIRATGSLDIDAGHEYLARGINWPRRLVRIRNSWTPGWGINGDAYIPFSDMSRLLEAQGDCVVPIGEV